MGALPSFREAKTAQAGALLLRLRGGRMHFLKLVELLYLADREAIRRWGVPITMDRYVSMDNGPVLSRTYGLIVEEGEKSLWSALISAPCGYEVELIQSCPPTDLLSRAEEKLLAATFEQFGRWNRWAIVDYVHKLPEWKDPSGSSTPITIQVILQACDASPKQIEAVVTELGAEAAAERALQRQA